MRPGVLVLVVGWLLGCSAPPDPMRALAEARPDPLAEVAPAPEPAQPPWQVVVTDARVENATLDAIAVWDTALDVDSLVLAPPDAAPAPNVVLVRVVPVAALPTNAGGWTRCGDDACAWLYVDVRTDLVSYPKIVAHELGHVLGGDEHSATPGDLMYFELLPGPGGEPVVSAEDVARVLAFNGGVSPGPTARAEE